MLPKLPRLTKALFVGRNPSMWLATRFRPLCCPVFAQEIGLTHSKLSDAVVGANAFDIGRIYYRGLPGMYCLAAYGAQKDELERGLK